MLNLNSLSEVEKIHFKKPPRSYEEQLTILIERGLIVQDHNFALSCLSNIGYYHLTPYWKVFYTNEQENMFKKDIFFNDIINLYKFDRALRRLLFHSISTLEVSFRTEFANFLCCKYKDPFIFSKHNLFDNQDFFEKSTEKLCSEVQNSREQFCIHYKNKYTEKIPPAWIAIELMTLGEVSKWYANLKHISDQDGISKKFELSGSLFKPFLYTITDIRNSCAHHARLWNKVIPHQPKLTRHSDFFSENLNRDGNKKIYNALVYLSSCLKAINSGITLDKEISKLIQQFKPDTKAMGFPDDWEKLSLWNLQD